MAEVAGKKKLLVEVAIDRSEEMAAGEDFWR